MLKKLKTEGITIIVSTPYMNEAELCDRVALMQHGRLMKIARPDQIIKDYHGILYKVKTDNIYQLIQDLKQFPKTKTSFPFGQSLHFTPIDDSFKIRDLSKYLTERGHQNIGVELIEPGVEDCFMALMAQEPIDNGQES
jgi:ABC-type multidrug transport system ATPase subunit